MHKYRPLTPESEFFDNNFDENQKIKLVFLQQLNFYMLIREKYSRLKKEIYRGFVVFLFKLNKTENYSRKFLGLKSRPFTWKNFQLEKNHLKSVTSGVGKCTRQGICPIVGVLKGNRGLSSIPINPVFSKLSVIFDMSSVGKRPTGGSTFGSSRDYSQRNSRTSHIASPGTNSVFHRRRSTEML